MERTWDNPIELAVAIEDRVRCGARHIVLTPATALWLAGEVQKACLPARIPAYESPDAKFRVDVYARGSCIVEVDAKGDILDIVGWASNALAARAAFDYLCGYEPKKSFEQRRKSWVEAGRIIPSPRTAP